MSSIYSSEHVHRSFVGDNEKTTSPDDKSRSAHKPLGEAPLPTSNASTSVKETPHTQAHKHAAIIREWAEFKAQGLIDNGEVVCYCADLVAERDSPEWLDCFEPTWQLDQTYKLVKLRKLDIQIYEPVGYFLDDVDLTISFTSSKAAESAYKAIHEALRPKRFAESFENIFDTK